MSIPYSYHTFVFPFIWNDSGSVSLKRFEKCMHPQWKPDYRQDKPVTPWQYGQYVYFNQAARNAMFTEKDSKNPIVYNYRFDLSAAEKDCDWLNSKKDETNRAEYVIEKKFYDKNGKVKEVFKASLKINGIRLRLFSTGVGMLVFELENYEYADENSVIRINEFGRRVFRPYIMDDKKSCGLCADSISIEFDSTTKIEGKINCEQQPSNSDIQLMKPILDLLKKDGYSVTASASKKSGKVFYIEPIIDDRMFVCCFYRNAEFAQSMAQRSDDGEYRYLTDAMEKYPSENGNLAARLYKMMFVDGDGLSCYGRTMMRQMLEEHIYPRWLEYSVSDSAQPEISGTITGVSEYSLISVTACGDDFVGSLINSFLTMYAEMAMLVLAQRASLLAFEQQISNCSCGKLRIGKIQHEYTMFQSRLLLKEVTPQQQGIELYDQLLKNLFIEKEKQEIEQQIQALFALESGMSERNDNLLLLILAAVCVIDAAVLIMDKPWSCVHLLTAILFVAVLVVYLAGHRKRIH